MREQLQSSFKATISVVQANAAPFLAPLWAVSSFKVFLSLYNGNRCYLDGCARKVGIGNKDVSLPGPRPPVLLPLSGTGSAPPASRSPCARCAGPA
jgi:hypothetical protein